MYWKTNKTGKRKSANTLRSLKCNYMVLKFIFKYGIWRTMIMRHHSVKFSLMEAGHTKFHPDWHFRLWKVRSRNSTLETLTEMAESVAASSRSNHNIPQLVDDPDCLVVFYDWASFFKKWFKPIPHITSYQHLRYDMISFWCTYHKNWDTYYFSCMANVNS